MAYVVKSCKVVSGVAGGLRVVVKRELLDGVLENAKMLHPRETVLLLRGRRKGDVLTVEDLVIPPLASHGVGFAGFPLHMLPVDFSLVGTVHSHPSSSLQPSTVDLNKAFGKILMIVAYPYAGLANVAVYNRNGERLELLVE